MVPGAASRRRRRRRCRARRARARASTGWQRSPMSGSTARRCSRSDNMFLRHERRARRCAHRRGELVIRCRALEPLLAARRPRPRWRAPMIEHQQLRWFRTTLLGRTPGWSPPAAAVGPWRPVRVERRRRLAVEDVRLRAAGATARAGASRSSCRLRALGAAPLARVDAAWSSATPSSTAGAARGRSRATTMRGRGAARISPTPARWWPHTHGEPACYDARLTSAAGPSSVELGADRLPRARARAIAFALRRQRRADLLPRRLLDAARRRLAWRADRAAVDAALAQARDAGMNMLRVGGTMVYESDDFYDLLRSSSASWSGRTSCSPTWTTRRTTPRFVAGVAREATQLLARLQARAEPRRRCAATREGEQQAAMWGAPARALEPAPVPRGAAGAGARALPRRALLAVERARRRLPAPGRRGHDLVLRRGRLPAPARGRAARRGALRQPSAWRSPTSPEPRARCPAARPRACTTRRGRRARPRDLGAGWDFDDVRDHYLGRLFGVDPVALRYADHDRYLALGRVVTGEVMAQRLRRVAPRALDLRRRPGVVPARSVAGRRLGRRRRGGRAQGGLVLPASARCSPSPLHVSDEGGNGLALHVSTTAPSRSRRASS